MQTTYNFILKKDFFFYSESLETYNIHEQYFSCLYGLCRVRRGYSWNGCTGAPDFKETFLASAVHDALYQYGKKNGVKRKDADETFLKALQYSNFKSYNANYLGSVKFKRILIEKLLNLFDLLNIDIAKVYYFAVRIFGFLFY